MIVGGCVCARSDAFVQDLKLLCKTLDFCARCNGREVASRLAKKSASVACLCKINGFCARSEAFVQNQQLLCKMHSTRSGAGNLSV